jgi:HD-GYP domain-containing protein (c-di-GMP phosphodiesterase class II)
MEKVRIEDLRQGMKLARTIYSPEGLILVRESTVITDHIITKLKQLGLPAAYISTVEGEIIPEPVSELTRVDLIKSLSKLDSEVRSGQNANLLASKQPLYDMVDEIVCNHRNLIGLTDIRLRKDYIYGHSVNVCIIAVKIAINMGYNQLKLADLAVGALFHDLGMTKLPLEILDKIGGLTDAELKLIHTHPEEGYNLLKQNQNIAASSAHVAFQHHERYNGTGYPRGMAGEAIHEFARITAVADVYDSMTTERLYRHAKSPMEAMNFIRANRGIEFDPVVVDMMDKIIFG